MNEGVEITQNASLGAKETVQVGIQNNINNVQVGLTPSNAVEMALGIFREHYPQLKQEALAEVKQLVIEEMKKIQPEDIIPPTPKIAVPILQNASITEEQELRRLYARLLSNSMNRTVKNKVYPGFVEVLNQLCVDEAKLLPYIYTKKVIPTITLRRESKDKNGEGADVIKNFSDIGEHVKCENPLNRPDRKFCVNADKLSSRKEEQLRGFFGLDTGRLNSAYPPVFRGEKRYARAA